MLQARKALPRTQRVAETLKGAAAKSWVEYSSYAVHRPYISVNDPTIDRVDWLMVDCDHEDVDRLPGSMPRPMWTAVTRETGRHHHAWRLAQPVLAGAEARMKPRRLLAAVERAVVWHLDADQGYTNTLTKNPWHDRWHVIWWPGARPVTLDEFEPWLLDIGAPAPANCNVQPAKSAGFSRNCDLFDHTRHWAYRNWSGDRTEVYGVAHAFNAGLAVPLPSKEVDATAKSICRFMSERYTGRPRGTKRTESRTAKAAAILAAEEAIRSTGQRPTVDMIAAVTGLNRATISRIQQTL